MRSRGQISSAGCSGTGDKRQTGQTRPRSASVLVGTAGSGLTPLLWVDWMDCSLADEHVLMRSASLLCVECLWVWPPDPEPVWIWFEFWRTGLSPASPGKVNEPGRLAGEPGIELQNPDPDFWPGLGGGGGRMSLPKLGAAMGEAIGGTAPGRALEMGVEGRGPTVARGIGATALAGVGVCAWSSGVWLGRLPCGLPPGGSRGGGTGRGVEPGP